MTLTIKRLWSRRSLPENCTALKAAYAEVVEQSYGQTKLKELLRFLLNKRVVIKEERGKYSFNRDYCY